MGASRFREIMTSKRFLLMLAVVGGAFALRVWGVGFDLPDISHPDEQHEVYRALRLAKGSFEWDRIGKGGFFYILFAEYGALFVTLKIAGTVSSPDDFMEMFVRDPSIFWLLGRTTVALLGTINVWLTFLIGRRVGGYAVGLIAAVLLALCSLSTLHAHLLTVDIPMTCGVLATVLFSLRLYDSGKLRDYLLAGFFAALAVMTKLSAAPIVAVVVLAHLLRCRNEAEMKSESSSWLRRVVDRRIMASGLLCLVVYCIGNPAILFKTVDAYQGMSAAVVGEPGREPAPERQHQVAYYAEATVGALGWPLAILCALSVIFCMVRRRPSDLLLLAFPILLYAAIMLTGSHWRHARFILPTLPLLLVMVAQLLWIVVQQVGLSKQAIPFVTTAIVVVLCAPRTVEIVKQNQCFTQPATTIQTRNWIEENIPSNTKILMLGYPGNREQRRNCPLQDTKDNMLAFAVEIEEESEMAAKFIRIKAKSQQGSVYDLTVIAPRDNWITLAEAKQTGARFVVVPVRDFATGARAEKTGRTAFYQQLQNDPQVVRTQTFKPETVSPYDSMWRDAVMEIYEILPPTPETVAEKQQK